MTKFNSEHDEYLWSGAAESGAVTGSGDVDSPTGWFAGITLEPDVDFGDSREKRALAHYGTRWLILHESNQGFVTVLQFDSEVKRNRRLIELEQAYAMYLAGVSEDEIVQAITGYRLVLEWHAGHDGKNLSWSEEAQRSTGDDVTEYVTSEIENLRIYQETVTRSWQEIGGDFAFARLGAKGGFSLFAGGVVVEALNTAALAWGPVSVVLNEQGEMEVHS